jgi:hypothetical protein
MSQENLAHSSLPQLFSNSVVRDGLADLGHAGLRYGESGEMLWNLAIIRAGGFFLKEKGLPDSPAATCLDQYEFGICRL